MTATLDTAVQQAIAEMRPVVAVLHKELRRNGLAAWTAGNVSGRVPGADLLVIKPSGVDYDELSPENMVVADFDGNVVIGERAASSDTAGHAYVYRHRPDVGGLVHTPLTVRHGVVRTWRDPLRPDRDGRRVRRTHPDGAVRGHRRHFHRRGHCRHAGWLTQRGDADAEPRCVRHRDRRQGRGQSRCTCEDVARTVHLARSIGDIVLIAQRDIDALYDPYQNVYGQQPKAEEGYDERR